MKKRTLTKQNADKLNGKILIIPSEFTEIGDSAFRGRLDIDEVILTSITNIGGFAFENSSIRILNCKDNSNLRSIEWYAFKNCKDLEKIEIDKEKFPTKLGIEVFKGCSKLPLVGISAELLKFGNKPRPGEFGLCMKFDSILNEFIRKKQFMSLSVELPNFTRENAIKNAGGIDERKSPYWFDSENNRTKFINWLLKN